jgi:hypothetical protein
MRRQGEVGGGGFILFPGARCTGGGGEGGEASKTEGTRRAGLLPSSVFISPPGTHRGPLIHLPILTHTQACIPDQQEVEFLDEIQTKV